MPDLPSARPRSRDGRQSLESAIAAIRETLENVRFGSIAVTIHDGRVVQLEVTEKRRLAT